MQYDQEVLVTYRKKDEVEMSTKNLKSLQTGIEPSVNEAESFEKKANVSESRFFIYIYIYTCFCICFCILVFILTLLSHN